MAAIGLGSPITPFGQLTPGVGGYGYGFGGSPVQPFSLAFGQTPLGYGPTTSLFGAPLVQPALGAQPLVTQAISYQLQQIHHLQQYLTLQVQQLSQVVLQQLQQVQQLLQILPLQIQQLQQSAGLHPTAGVAALGVPPLAAIPPQPLMWPQAGQSILGAQAAGPLM